MSTKILKLSDYRIDDAADSEINLLTVIDVAIRDLHEILMYWGSDRARQRTEEYELMLLRAYSEFVVGQPDCRL